MLVYLGCPADGDEAALLLPGELRGGAAADVDELADLLADCRCGLALPVGRFLPRCDLSGLAAEVADGVRLLGDADRVGGVVQDLAGVLVLDAGHGQVSVDASAAAQRNGAGQRVVQFGYGEIGPA